MITSALLAVALMAVTPESPPVDAHVVDQYGNLYRFKVDAFQSPYEDPLEFVGRRSKSTKSEVPKVVSAERLKKGLERCRAATCRVKVPGFTQYKDKKWQKSHHIGSGTVIAQDQSYFYVITAGHVIGSKKKLSLEFYRGQYKSTPIPAEVVWTKWNPKFTEEDLALVRVRKALFGKFPHPVVIPLAKKGRKIDKKEVIVSVGCPHGIAAVNWSGITITQIDDIIPFTPAPVEGRSGSAICNLDATEVLGVMVRKYETIGVAISADKIPRKGDK